MSVYVCHLPLTEDSVTLSDTTPDTGGSGTSGVATGDVGDPPHDHVLDDTSGAPSTENADPDHTSSGPAGTADMVDCANDDDCPVLVSASGSSSSDTDSSDSDISHDSDLPLGRGLIRWF